MPTEQGGMGSLELMSKFKHLVIAEGLLICHRARCRRCLAHLNGHLKELNVSAFPPGSEGRVQDHCVSPQAAHQLAGTLQMHVQEVYLSSTAGVRTNI